MSDKLKAVVLLTAALVVGVWLGRRGNPSEPRLIFFAIGQGDCALLQTESANVLIDAAPANEYSDAAKTILLPKLRELGVDRIDLVLLSHPDDDHIGGLVSLSKRVEVRQVGMASHFRSSKTLLSVLDRAGISGDRRVWFQQDSRIQTGSWSIDVFLPSYQADTDDNNGSLFVRLGNGKALAVFSGDANIQTENSMIPGRGWKAQVMKAGHHGSKFSTGPEWLAAIQPQFVVFSCGRNNNFGHPSPEALARVERLGARVMRTDRDGTVTFRVGEQGFELVKR